MQYRKDKYGNLLSVLGYGCMRFPRKQGHIDMQATEAQILQAVDGGVNYFDTAYIYPGSEECLGRILEENQIRSKVNIATKLPQYLMRSAASIEKTFQEELRRLRTDYIDYYLMHKSVSQTISIITLVLARISSLSENNSLAALINNSFSSSSLMCGVLHLQPSAYLLLHL